MNNCESIELTVMAPCYNEAGNLPELVRRLEAVFSKRGIRGEIVLVDDGSIDETPNVLRELAQKHETLRVIHHEQNRGIEAGWQTGVAAAKGEYVCLMDADLQNLPEDVWRLFREIRYRNVDMVQGFRSSIGRLKDSRFILSKGLNVLLNALFGMNLRDNKSGFAIARREVLIDVLRHDYKYRYFQSFVAVAAHAKGYSVRQIETLFESRHVGTSFMPKLPWKVIYHAFVDIGKALLEYRFLFKKEDITGDYLKVNQPTREIEPFRGWRRILFEFYFLTTIFHKWLIGRKARRYYLELRRSQYFSLAQVKQLQEAKLRKLIHHAYAHVPYYRDMFKRLGIGPGDIETLEDLQKLPLLTKADVRENLYFDMLSDNHEKSQVLRISTSGSTGEPFVCFADKHQLEIRWASTLRSQEWTGYRFGDRTARLWHQTIGMTWLQIIREKIDALLTRRTFLPAFEMTESNIEKFVARLRRGNPVLVDGYAESFNCLATYLRSRKIEGFRPRAIMSSAQVLPQESRRIIEEAFGCKVFDKYGAREFSGIAYECDAHEGHHVAAESYIVEVLKDGRPAQPGETGEIVITDLNNFCMPFIRYRIGDLALAMDPNQECPCGRGLPRIGNIEGRVQSIIKGTNGAYIPGSFFFHLFKEYDYAMRQFQVVQEAEGSIVLKIVQGPRFTQEAMDDILHTLHKFLGEAIEIDVQFVDKIEMVRTGKFQGTISKLNFDFQELATTN